MENVVPSATRQLKLTWEGEGKSPRYPYLATFTLDGLPEAYVGKMLKYRGEIELRNGSGEVVVISRVKRGRGSFLHPGYVFESTLEEGKSWTADQKEIILGTSITVSTGTMKFDCSLIKAKQLVKDLDLRLEITVQGGTLSVPADCFTSSDMPLLVAFAYRVWTSLARGSEN